MVCPKCGKETNNEFKFCTQCGFKFKNEIEENNVDNIIKYDKDVNKSNYNTEFVNNVEYSNNINVDDNSSGMVVKKKHTGLIIGLICILVVAVGVIVFLLLWNFGNKDKPTNINNNGNGNYVTKYDNYDVNITMKMEIAGVSMDSTFAGTVDEVNQTEHFKVDVSSFGISMSMESYSDFKNGYTYISDPIFGGWTKYSEATKTIDMSEILNSLTNMDSATKIDDNHYKIVINSDTVNSLMDTSDFDYDILDGDVKADVYLKNGYIDKIVYDMGEMMKGVSSFTLEMSISNYNNAGSVVIPDEVIKGATQSKW